MKKRLIALILTVVMMILFPLSTLAEGENEEKVNKEAISAQSPHAILFDLKSGAVLYEKQAGERVYPAALTDIMTAVLVLENCNVEELVTASETALSNVKPGDNKIGIIKDEKLSVRQLLYGMILASASDATNVLAEKVGGSIEAFVLMMNEKAASLGMNNTNFTNPGGEHDKRHYTTPYDMSKLVVYAMKIPEFSDIVKCQSYTMPPTEKSSSARKITNRNHFVSNLLRND